MTDAQQWLDQEYPLEKRKEIKSIGPENKIRREKGLIEVFVNSFKAKLLNIPTDLTGLFINFDNFENLTELFLPNRKIDINSIAAFPISLERLQLASNSFPESTLELFSHLINLHFLDIGTMNGDNDHNKWYGSLEPLKDMKNLNWLCLGSTEIDRGLEFLPKHKFINLGFESDFSHSKCLKLKKILKIINYDLNLFNLNFYNQEYLNNQQLLYEFKLIIKELETIREIGPSYYSDIQKGLKQVENNLDLNIEKLINLVTSFENKRLEIKELNNDLNDSQKQINNFSNQLFKVNEDLKYYKNSQQQAMNSLRSRLPLLINNLDNASTNNSLLPVANIAELKCVIVGLTKDNNELGYELNKLTKLVEECEKSLEENDEEIKDLTTWKETSLAKIDSLGEKNKALNSTNEKLNKTIKDNQQKIQELETDLKSETKKKKVLTASSWIQYGTSWIVNEKTQNKIETVMTSWTSYYVLRDLDNWSYECIFMLLGIVVYKLINKFLNWWRGADKQNIFISVDSNSFPKKKNNWETISPEKSKLKKKKRAVKKEKVKATNNPKLSELDKEEEL